MRLYSIPLIQLIGAILALFTLNEAASAPLEEIVVTAQKRSESLQDVPVSVTVASGEFIADVGIRTYEDLSTSLPAVNVSKGGASDQLYVRGIGSGFNGGFEQAVGLYIDGLYMGRSRGGRASFVDMERVEVLKGPQSLYFGNSSIGGAISVATRSPGNEFNGDVTATYEPEYNEFNLEAGLDLPLTEDLAVRVAARIYDAGGYVENTNPAGGDDGAATEDIVGRITAVWTPSEALDVTVKYTQGKSDIAHPFLAETFLCHAGVSAPAARSCPAHRAMNLPFDNELNYKIQSSADDLSELNFRNALLDWSYDFGGMTLTSTTGYIRSKNFDLQDLDTGPLEIFHASQYDELEQWSQEVRLESGGGELIDWMVGGYYQDGESIYDVILAAHFIPPLAAGGGDRVLSNRTRNIQDEKTLSAFASLTYRVIDTVRLGAGARYTRVEKDLDKRVFWGTNSDFGLARGNFVETDFNFPNFATVGAYRDSLNQDDILPNVRLEWDALPEGMLYFSYAAGFKAGGFDLDNRSNGADLNAIPDYDEETADAFELGFKGNWLDNSLRANLALFYVDYAGVQQSVLNAETFVFSVGNAAESRALGAELDISWAPTDRLTFYANATFMDTQFDEFHGACSQAQNDAGACPNSRGATITITNPDGSTTVMDVGPTLTRDLNAEEKRLETMHNTMDMGMTVDNVEVSASGSQDLGGHETTFAPAYSGFLRAVYTQPVFSDLTLTVDGNLYFTDGYHIHSDFDPNIRVGSYVKLGLRVAIADEGAGWEIAMVGKNLNDKKVPFFCNDLPASPGSYRCSLTPPRTLAVQGRYSW